MHLGFIGENSLQSVEADCLFAVKHGFTGLEDNYWGDFKDLTPDTVARMHAIHEKHGIRVSALGLWGFNHLAPDPAVRETAHAALNRAIDFARTLRADVLITGGGDIPNEPPGRKVAEFLKVFPPFLDRIAKAGLQPAFYAVHGNSFFDSLQTYERAWEHLPEIKIKFDPANWHSHGDDYLDILRRYGNKIGYVHIKEHLNINGRVVSQPAAGMGDIAWGKVMAFLYEHHYTGWLSVEPHGPIWSQGEMRHKMLLLTKKYMSNFLL